MYMAYTTCIPHIHHTHSNTHTVAPSSTRTVSHSINALASGSSAVTCEELPGQSASPELVLQSAPVVHSDSIEPDILHNYEGIEDVSTIDANKFELLGVRGIVRELDGDKARGCDVRVESSGGVSCDVTSGSRDFDLESRGSNVRQVILKGGNDENSS